MSVTVALDEELAGRLQQQADSLRVSLRDLAVGILQDAVQRSPAPEAWKNINARRLDLIALEYSQGLSTTEAQELDALQEAVAKACEPEDRQLLKTLGDSEQRASHLSGTPNA